MLVKRAKLIKTIAGLLLAFVTLTAQSSDAFGGTSSFFDKMFPEQEEKEHSYLRIYHLDAGRKYFSAEDIEDIIDELAAANYTHLELAISNGGLRLLLDDIAVTTADHSYTSEEVRAAVQEANRAYGDNGMNELTQGEMDELIRYAKEKGLSIIPLFNSPGHMDALVGAMQKLGMQGVSFHGSATTMDLSNEESLTFTKALIQKYIAYFAARGSEHFNLGADEYADDVGMGFHELIEEGRYGSFIQYVNDLSQSIKDHGMQPMAFNDCFYYEGVKNQGTFDTDILIAYWSTGWGQYTFRSAKDLAKDGFTIINTNASWYYILGDVKAPYYTYATALEGVTKSKYNNVYGSGEMPVAGAMACFWCDDPARPYNESEKNRVKNLIQTFAESNPELFTSEEDAGKGQGSDQDQTQDQDQNSDQNKSDQGDTGGKDAAKEVVLSTETSKHHNDQTQIASPIGSGNVTPNSKGSLKRTYKNLLLQQSIASGKKLKISWMKVKDASGYEIYSAPCGKSKLKLSKTIKSGSATSAKIRGLKAKDYKVQVKAYRLVGSKKMYLASSNVTHTRISPKGKVRNATKVRINKKSVRVARGKSATIKTTVSTKKRCTLLYKSHCARVNYYTSDAHIAKVDKNGKITGVSKGQCTIYAVAPNGLRAAVKVTVK